MKKLGLLFLTLVMFSSGYAQFKVNDTYIPGYYISENVNAESTHNNLFLQVIPLKYTVITSYDYEMVLKEAKKDIEQLLQYNLENNSI